MSEVVYTDNDVRQFAKDYTKIPLTFKSSGDLPVGTVVGKKTTGGYAEKTRRTTTTVQAVATDTTITVTSVAPFAVGRNVKLMKADGTAVEDLGAITAINAETKVITVTTAVTATHAVGSYLYVNDGSEKALGILAEPVADDGSEIVASVYIMGCFVESLLTGLDAIAKTDLGVRSVNGIAIVPGA